MDRLSALRLFLRVVEGGSISAAGRALGLSSTAASKRLKDLEAELGVRLVQRTTRHVAPTEAGSRLYRRLTGPLGELEEAVLEARELHDQPCGLLRVVARRSFALLHLLPALPSFRACHPRVEIDLTLTETLGLAPTHGVDLVIRLAEPAEKSLAAYRLASARRVLCASPGYLRARGEPAEVAELSGHDCLGYRQALEPPVWIFETPSGRRSLEVDGPLHSNSGEALRDAAVLGLGLVLLPLWLVGDDLATGRLRACLTDQPGHPAGYEAEIYAVHARADFVPAKITAFVEHLRAETAHLRDK